MIQFTPPKLTIAEHEGQKFLFAAQWFVDDFPELINHVFVVPDSEYNGLYFDQYVEARIKGYLEVEGSTEKSFKID